MQDLDLDDPLRGEEGEGPETGGEGVLQDPDQFCLICLGSIQDRTILPSCRHSQFCFACIHRWSLLKRKCPLCNSSIGSFMIHDIHSTNDYSKFFLRPIHETSIDDGTIFASSSSSSASSSRQPPVDSLLSDPVALRDRRRLPPARRHAAGRRGAATSVCASTSSSAPLGRDATHAEAAFERLDAEVAHRRWVYRHGLYAKHVGSNRYSKYKSAPSPRDFSRDADAQRRVAVFVRRELLCWPNLDISFLTTYILQILSTLDAQSDVTLQLLGEFLGKETAHHFLHELVHFIRSPYRSLQAWDREAQYADPFASASAPASLAQVEQKNGDERERGSEVREEVADTSAGSAQVAGPGAQPDAEAQRDRGIGDKSDEGEDEVLRRQEVIQRRAKLLARLQEAKNQLQASPSSAISTEPIPTSPSPISTASSASAPQANDANEEKEALPARARELREKLLKNKLLLLGKREEEMRRRAREARLKCLLTTQKGRRKGDVVGRVEG